MSKLTILFVFLAAFLAACGFNGSGSVDRPSIKASTLLPDPSDERWPYLNNHFVSCLAKTNLDEAKIIEGIKDAIVKEDTKDIVLYFHGGLSSQAYMVEELGPLLIKPLSSHGSKRYYPIFVQYHAGITEFDVSANGFNAEQQARRQRFVNDKNYQRLLKELNYFRAENSVTLKNTNVDDELSTGSRKRAYQTLINAFGRKELRVKQTNDQNGLSLNDDDIEFLSDILQAEYLSEIEVKVTTTDNDFISAHRTLNTFTIATADLVGSFDKPTVTNFYNRYTSGDESVLGDIFDFANLKLRVIRILARFAIGSDHGFAPTIVEEIADSLNLLPEFGQTHWKKVKRHADTCFREGRNGATLLTVLDKLKQEGVIDTLNIISHSAGSIPIGRAIDYVNYKDLQPFDYVTLIVPAVNQKDYAGLYQANHNSFNQLDIIPLTRHFEVHDKTAILPGSLLYYVSSIAENKWTMDRMLLLDQHLQSSRSPYKKWFYRVVAGERQAKGVWNSLKRDSKTEKLLFPFCKTESCQQSEGVHATHENTKYLHKASKLKNCIFERFNDHNYDCSE